MIDYLDVKEIMGKKITDNHFSKCLGYFEDNEIIGFLDYSVIYEKVEINDIYVGIKYRNLGIASKLLEYMINSLEGIDNITLEVRVDNEIAIKLYKKFGFEIIGVRKNYYKDIDGYLMGRGNYEYTFN